MILLTFCFCHISFKIQDSSLTSSGWWFGGHEISYNKWRWANSNLRMIFSDWPRNVYLEIILLRLTFSLLFGQRPPIADLYTSIIKRQTGWPSNLLLHPVPLCLSLTLCHWTLVVLVADSSWPINSWVIPYAGHDTPLAKLRSLKPHLTHSWSQNPDPQKPIIFQVVLRYQYCNVLLKSFHEIEKQFRSKSSIRTLSGRKSI